MAGAGNQATAVNTENSVHPRPASLKGCGFPSALRRFLGQSSGPEVSCKLPQLVYIGTQTVVAVEIINAP